VRGRFLLCTEACQRKMRLLKGIFSKVDQLLTGRRPVDDRLFDELEELLIQADLSVTTTTKLVDSLREAARKERLSESDQIKAKLKELLETILAPGGAVGLRVGERHDEPQQQQTFQSTHAFSPWSRRHTMRGALGSMPSNSRVCIAEMRRLSRKRRKWDSPPSG